LNSGASFPDQPHHLDVPPRLPLEPPARLNLVQVAVEINLEQRRWMVRGPASRFRHNTGKTQRCQIQFDNEDVDNPHRAIFAHVVVEAVWKQCYLTTVTAFDKSGHPNLQVSPWILIKNHPFSHSLGGLRAFADAHADGAVRRKIPWASG